MRRIPIDSNVLVNIKEIKENEKGVLFFMVEDTNGIIKEVTGYIESDKTVKDFTKNLYEPSTMKDWNNYLESLVEANYDEPKLREKFVAKEDLRLSNLSKSLLIEASNITSKIDAIDEKIETLDDLEDLTTEQKDTLKALKVEKKELRETRDIKNAEAKELESNKEGVLEKNTIDYLSKVKSEVEEKIKNKKLFFFSGLNRKISESGEAFYAIELSHPGKTTRNIMSPKNGIVVDYSLIRKDTNEALTLGEVRDANTDYANVELKSILAKNNTNDIIESVFLINENAISSIVSNEKFGPIFYGKRLLEITSDSSFAKDLNDFKANNKFEDLTIDKINELKEIYGRIKNDILENGMGDYKIGVVVITKPAEVKAIAVQFKDSLQDSLFAKSVGKGIVVPNEIKMLNITGVQNVPTNFINKINTANQFYFGTSFSPNINPLAKEGSKSIPCYGSLDILKQIDELVGIKINEVEKKDLKEEDISDISDR